MRNGSSMIRFHSRVQSIETSVGNAVIRNRIGFPVCLFILVIFYFPEFTDYMMRADGELAAWRGADILLSSRNHIKSGRWGTWIIELCLMRPLNPIFSMFVFGSSLVAAFFLFCNALKIERSPFVLVSFALFSAFPTWYYLVEFKGTILANGLAVASASLAGFMFNARIPFARLWFVLCLVVAISIYQSVILITLVVAIASFLFETGDREHDKRSDTETFLVKMVNLTLLSIFGVAAYLVIWKALLWMFDMNVGYIGIFLSIRNLIDQPHVVFEKAVWQVITFYSGMKSNFSGILPFSGVLFLIGCSAYFRRNRHQTLLFRSSTFVILLLLPALLSLLSAGELPVRSLLAIPFVYWLFVVLALQHDIGIVRTAAKVLVVLVAVQFFQLSTYSSFSHRFVSVHDQLLAGQLYSRIVEQIDGFDRSKTYPVDFVGSYTFPNHAAYLEKREHQSVTGLSIFGFGEQWGRAARYMKLHGMGDFRVIGDEERARIADRVEAMTSWPDRGSVRNIDGIVVVKFGPTDQSR